MSKNKRTMTDNLTGILDSDNWTVVYVDKKNGGEMIYDLKKVLEKYDDLEVSITVKYDSDIDPVIDIELVDEEL